MHADFYNFAKRVNSTKRPTGSGLWSPEINLKLNTSMRNPVLQMGSQQSAEEINSYNYLKLGDVGYYFIDDWTSIRGDFWEATASLDLLATYADAIRATSAFVEYDTTANPGIADHRLSQLETSTTAANAAGFSPTIDSAGTYILTVTGKSGAVGTFGLKQAALNNLLESVSQWASSSIDGDTPEAVLKQWARKAISSGSAPANIRSCLWVPFDISGASKEIYLGEFPTGVSGSAMTASNAIRFYSKNIPIPWQVSDWRACALTHSFTLVLPFVGTIGLSAEQLIGETSITVDYAVDLRTADVSYIVYAGNIRALGSYSGNASASVPVGVSNVNALKVAGGIFSSVAAMTSGNVTASASGLGETAVNILVPNVTCVGTLQSPAGAGMTLDIELSSQYKPYNAAPSSVSAVMGTPTMQTKSLAGLTGFVKTRGASVAADCGADELSAINAMLDGGIYLE